ncbi:MAG TPA: hypothetical protein VGI81_09930 [Tepidisphaeraceae bacterium]|jgi:hypothetical protein
MNARISFLLLIAMLSCLVRADPMPQREDVRITIHPAAPGEPALRNALLPEAADQQPGNAATVYLMAFEDAGRVTADPSFDFLQGATAAELDEAKAEALLNAHRTMLEPLAVAAHRSGCDWAPPTRERGLRAVLPYLNAARAAGDLLSIKAKLAIKRRNYPEAIDALRDGFALADHLEREPLLIQALVAVSIRTQLLADVRELVQQPGAPNLYWPLVNLPPAGRDRIRIVQTEKASLFLTYPSLRHVEQLSAAESRRVFDELQSLVAGSRADRWAELLLGMVRNYPKAKEFLVAEGRSRDDVEAMPADTAVLAYYVGQYVEQFDGINKRAGLPLWQASAQIAQPTAAPDGPRTPDRLHSYGSAQREDPRTYNPLLAILPGYRGAFAHFAGVERDRAMLQVVEGIRAYAAAHNGAMPPSLDALSPDTPAPVDPMLNRPFEYHAEGQTTTLTAPAPAGEPPQSAKTYHITLAH